MVVENGKGKINVKGFVDYEKFKKGQRLSYFRSILAKCYDCMAGYSDGRKSCGIKECPLFPFMPYKDTEDGKGEEEQKEEGREEEQGKE